jgi:hypothetical protein
LTDEERGEIGRRMAAAIPPERMAAWIALLLPGGAQLRDAA